MSNLILNVEVMPSTVIEYAIREASELALKLDVAYVKFVFNGVTFSVGSRPSMKSMQEAVKEYYRNTQNIICK